MRLRQLRQVAGGVQLRFSPIKARVDTQKKAAEAKAKQAADAKKKAADVKAKKVAAAIFFFC